MTSQEVASLVDCGLTTIKRYTKKALENGIKTIEIKGLSFSFEVVSNSFGKAYSYTQIKQSSTKSKSAKTISFALLQELKDFDITKTSFEAVEKALIIEFYNKYNYSLNTIIKALLIDKNIYPDKVQIASLNKKINRWIEAFKTQGIKALEDKRGSNISNIKVDENSLTLAVTGAGSRGIRDNFYGAWEFYNFLEAKKEGILDQPTFVFKNSKSIKLTDSKKIYISYTAFIKAVKRLCEQNPQIKAFLEKGKDALLQDYVVGIKDVGYINQEWQVDSTKFDFMCKIPTDNGYKIGRVNVTAVIDVYSKKAVVNLTESIDSYAQVRVLYKAFQTFGIAETIYTDNGRDYLSNHYQKLLLDLGITQIKAKVGQGRQKGAIERFFGVTQSEWASLPGYIGNDVEKRTKIENQTASKIDIRTSKATRINQNRLLTLDELKLAVENLLDMKYMSYSEFEEFSISDIKLENVRRKLGKSKVATLQTDGVRFNNFTYQSAELWLNGLNRGQKVEVYENIDNINEVYIYLNDEFICSATNRDLGIDAMTLEEHKKAVKAYKANNIAPVNQKIKEAEKLYEEMQDYKVQKALNHTPEYKKPKNKPNKGATNKENNKTIKDTNIQDELYELAQKFA